MRITSVLPQIYAGNLKREYINNQTNYSQDSVNDKPANALNYVAPVKVKLTNDTPPLRARLSI